MEIGERATKKRKEKESGKKTEWKKNSCNHKEYVCLQNLYIMLNDFSLNHKIGILYPIAVKRESEQNDRVGCLNLYFFLSLGETLFRWDTNTCTHSLIPNGKYICVICVCVLKNQITLGAFAYVHTTKNLFACDGIYRAREQREIERAQQQIHQRFIIAGVCLLQQITTRTRIISQWAQKLCIITTFFWIRMRTLFYVYVFFII